jgi:hypothetical protein
MKGQHAQIISYKDCAGVNKAVCFSLNHDDCLIKESGNPPTGLVYLLGGIIVVLGTIGFALMWLEDRGYKHEESMKALG